MAGALGGSARRGRGYRPRTNTDELSQPADAVLRPHRRRADGGGGVRPLPAHRRQREREGRRAAGRRPSGAAINLYREDCNARRSSRRAKIGARRGRWRRRCARNDRQGARRRAWTSCSRRSACGASSSRSGSRAIADVGSATARLPGRARPRRPGQPAVRHAPGLGRRSPRSTRACVTRVTGVRGGRAARRRAGAGGDAAGRRRRRRSPSDRGRGRRSATSATTPPRSRRPGFLGARDRVARARAQGDGVRRRARRPPAGGRHPGRLLRPRLHLRACWSRARCSARSTRFLQAARRAGRGRLHRRRCRPTGHDEFAALGEEFNKMSRQLEERLEELDQERARLQDAMRRIGETFASNLDREGLLRDRRQDRGRRRRRRRRAARRCARTPARRSSRWRSTGLGRRARGGDRARPRRRCSRPASRARRTVDGVAALVAPAAPRRRRPRARVGRRLGRARAAGRSAPPSASSSTTSPGRPRCRSRTSACTRRSSARR